MHEDNNAKTGGTVNNSASGQVGIQAAHVTESTVWIGAQPSASTITDIITELKTFRDHLTRVFDRQS